MKIEELIENLKNRPVTPEETTDVQRRSWLEALDALFESIEQWVDPAVQAGVLEVSRGSTEIIDGDLGNYVVPVLYLKHRQLTVRLEPAGAHVVGLVSMEGMRFRGLVNLVFGPFRVPFVLQADGGWKALPHRGDPVELNAGSFTEILNELLLDA